MMNLKRILLTSLATIIAAVLGSTGSKTLESLRQIPTQLSVEQRLTNIREQIKIKESQDAGVVGKYNIGNREDRGSSDSSGPSWGNWDNKPKSW